MKPNFILLELGSKWLKSIYSWSLCFHVQQQANEKKESFSIFAGRFRSVRAFSSSHNGKPVLVDKGNRNFWDAYARGLGILEID